MCDVLEADASLVHSKSEEAEVAGSERVTGKVGGKDFLVTMGPIVQGFCKDLGFYRMEDEKPLKLLSADVTGSILPFRNTILAAGRQ